MGFCATYDEKGNEKDDQKDNEAMSPTADITPPTADLSEPCTPRTEYPAPFSFAISGRALMDLGCLELISIIGVLLMLSYERFWRSRSLGCLTGG